MDFFSQESGLCGLCVVPPRSVSVKCKSGSPSPTPFSREYPVPQQKQQALSVCHASSLTSRYSTVGQAFCSLAPERDHKEDV